VFSFFKRKPKNQDVAFQDLAQMLHLQEEGPTYKRGLLDSEKLDYSVESLGHIDKYLTVVHADQVADQDELMRVVLRVGAYVGEVIRRNAQTEYHWLDYEVASKQCQVVKEMGMSIGTAAVLWGSADRTCFPLAKVCKFLDNGEQDSVRFLAQVVIAQDSGAND